MKIIGLTGAIGHGKSTIAKIFCDIEPNAIVFETSEVISEVANKLLESYSHIGPSLDNSQSIQSWLDTIPAVLSDTLKRSIPPKTFTLSEIDFGSTSPEYIKLWEFIAIVSHRPTLASTLITQNNKYEYRALLQWIGGYCVENIDPVIWNKELLRRAENALKENSTLVILGGIRFKEEAELTRHHGGTIIEVVRPSNVEQDVLDPTERNRKLVVADCIVLNDEGIESLKHKISSIYNDMKQGVLKSRY